MDRAVEKLDEYLQTKTVHSTKELCRVMGELCHDVDLFTTGDAHQDFAQRCRNFEIYSEQSGRTGWGRKEFERWWNDESLVDEIKSTPLAFPSEDLPYMPDEWGKASMQELIRQVEYCGYGCEAGVLVNNVAFIELKRRVIGGTHG